MVGCSHSVVIAFRVAIASKPPAAPRQCPIIDCNRMKATTDQDSDNRKEKQQIASLNLKQKLSMLLKKGYLCGIDFDL